ncbi:MAG: serine/threonine-protein kinase [Candidatus Sericytochromatia bacterium]
MNNILIDEKYALEKILQESRMGTTYLAKNIKDNTKCIIKTVNLHTHDNKAKIKSIEDEAKVLSHLKHKNIPKLIEVFTKTDNLNKLEETKIFLVQQYIEGRNLQEIIDKEKSFSEIEAVEIIIKLCNICDYIHSFSPPILHQDIKPANIILSPDQSINLIDFGAVKQKILNIESSGLSTIIGTQGFMSIEQFEGKAVPASDIYSMGLTLISLITRKSPLSLNKKGLNFTFDDIKISEKLKKIVSKMVEPNFQKRYQSVKELKSNLELFLANPNEDTTKLFKRKLSNEEFLKSQLIENERIKIVVDNSKTNWKKVITTYSFIFIATIFLHFIIGFIIVFIYIFMKKSHKILNKKSYTLTNKRLIVIEKEKDYRKVESYNFDDIKLVNIPQVSYKNNVGSIELIRNNEEKLLIEDVQNVDIIYKIFREMIKENWHGK